VNIPVSPSDQHPAKHRSNSHSAAVIERSVDDAVRLDNVRILVVDDNADARKMLARVFTGCGAVTKEAANMSEAMELTESFQPQVLVSDIGMPGEDGIDLIRRLRE